MIPEGDGGSAAGVNVLEPPTGGAPPVAANGAVPASVPPDWLAQMPLEGDYAPLKLDKTLHRYKGVPDVLKAVVEQHKALSVGGVKIPTAESKPEEVRAFWTKLGVPENAEGYKDIRAPEIAGMTLSGPGIKGFIDNVALKEGFTPKQVQAAVNWLGEFQGQQRDALIGGWIDGQETLRAEWGANFDRQVTIAKRGLAHALKASGAGDEVIGILTTSGIHQHPGFVKLAAWMGRNLMEEGLVPGSPDGGHTSAQLDEAIGATAKKLGGMGKSDPQYAATMAAHEAALKARYGTDEVGAQAPR